jgi:hypothetical protein
MMSREPLINFDTNHRLIRGRGLRPVSNETPLRCGGYSLVRTFILLAGLTPCLPISATLL